MPSLSPAVLGTLCCMFAAIGYTASNMVLRRLTVDHSPVWILFVKETVAVVLVGPWLAYLAARGKPSLPGGRMLLMLASVGLLVQLVGNLSLIWAMGVVGIAITVATSIGVNLLGCGLLARGLLGERISLQSTLAMALLILSVLLLSFGASQANASISGAVASGTFWTAIGVGAGCLAGATFATLNVAIRHSAMAGVNLAAIGFMIPAMGTLGLAPILLGQIGIPKLLETPSNDFLLMLAAGLLNILSYLAIIKGIHLTTVVHANVLAASQVAMAAVAGWLLFHEAASLSLVLGVVLAIVGTVLVRPAKA